MIIQLLMNGLWEVAVMLVLAIVISLSFHEFGHAAVALLNGDPTAKQAGRLTLNPLAHIDPLGLLMVMTIGFGYAKPVPVDHRNCRNRLAPLWIAAAGPAMNLLLAILTINIWSLGAHQGLSFFTGEGQQLFFYYLAIINLILMLFNLIPLGPLDGHYILPYFLPRPLAARYQYLNARYGAMLLLGLIILNIIGVPVFSYVFEVGRAMIPWIQFV